jgi:hypothetical protein
MLKTAYIDESGHESRNHVILAGFVGDDQQWDACAEAWKVGLGQRKSLHMCELRWTSKSNYRVKKLLQHLGPIPYKSGLTPVFCGVNVSDYSDLISGTLVTKANKGYVLALYHMVPHILATLKGEERLKLVLEENMQYAPFLALTQMVCSGLAKVVSSPIFRTPSGLPRLAGVEFIPKESSLLTQPADYLAFSILQHCRDPRSQKARWCAPILGSGLGVGEFVSREKVRRGVGVTVTGDRLRTFREIEQWLDPILESLGKVKKAKGEADGQQTKC